MGNVFVSVTMSVDGRITPEFMEVDQPIERWGGAWGELQAYALAQRFMRRNLGFGDDGETGPDDDLLRRTFERTGASILGKRMFSLGERLWPENAPFHTPVFVLTHERRDPWVRPGGTTFHFVNDGLESALRQARAVVGDRDIRISGGANVIVQALNGGFVDEMHLAVAPVILGAGVRLFDGIDRSRVSLEPDEATQSPHVTHLRYRVRSR